MEKKRLNEMQWLHIERKFYFNLIKSFPELTKEYLKDYCKFLHLHISLRK